MIDLISVISSFGETLTVDRATEGIYTEGVFVPGDVEQIDIMASVQPAGANTRPLPEGVRVEDVRVVFSATRLQMAVDPTSVGADRFTYAGGRFEIYHVDDWASGGQGRYYRMLAVRIRNAEVDEE